MGLLNFKQNKEKLAESDIVILRNAVEKGTPCIPFIPINGLQQSLTIAKPEGVRGYFVAKIPALYPDGTIKYLYKEEFMLWTASIATNIQNTGRAYFFIGFEQLVEELEDSPNEYLNPAIFYQNNLTLYRTDFQEEVSFFSPAHSPAIELTFIPVDHNIKFKHLYVINYNLVANIYPPEKVIDHSGFIESFEQWRDLQYPTGGQSLQELFDAHKRQLISLLENMYQ